MCLSVCTVHIRYRNSFRCSARCYAQPFINNLTGVGWIVRKRRKEPKEVDGVSVRCAFLKRQTMGRLIRPWSAGRDAGKKIDSIRQGWGEAQKKEEKSDNRCCWWNFPFIMQQFSAFRYVFIAPKWTTKHLLNTPKTCPRCCGIPLKWQLKSPHPVDSVWEYVCCFTESALIIWFWLRKIVTGKLITTIIIHSSISNFFPFSLLQQTGQNSRKSFG